MTKRRRMMNMRTGGLLDTEIKFLDVNRSETALTAPTDCTGKELQHRSGCTGCLNAPVQGDGPSIRVGHKIKCFSIFIQGYIAFPEATEDQDIEMQTGSIHLVQDRQKNAVPISSEDIYQNDNGTARADLYWKRSISNPSRFKVIRRITVNLSNSHHDITSVSAIAR